ncbi:unnamed protein product [Rotaria socialis]|uniref:Uncharacterized protein n=2 Tax=Rotaria socialis TaxID=392032 RepID=A0A817M572_9BILA|nr:unnamed protein product [Rotaria socialis]
MAHVLNRNDLKDCLYSNEINNITNEWILIRYCISEDDFENQFECYGNAKLTFEELKLKRISGEDLFQWNAPVDTIDNYEKYSIENNFSMKNYFYCNCSKEYFGKDCLYSFNEISSNITFSDVILTNYLSKNELSYEDILNDEYLLICYEGIKCNSTICLDWRQICDGFMDCENGEDEFEDCFSIEINKCKENEYRCFNGMCIPQSFFIDFSYDCGDMADEEFDIDEIIIKTSECYQSLMTFCDFSQSRWNLFSCGDGEYAPIEGYDLLCVNERDSFYRRNLSLSSLYDNNQCWFLMLCTLDEYYFDLFDYDSSLCRCTASNREKLKCLKYFETYCPSLFYFQTGANFVYPFIKFVFDKAKIDSSKWWEPTHICFKNKSCSNFLSASDLIIDDLTCIERETIPKRSDSISHDLKILFSYCNIPIEDKRLFYCNKSKQFISKYRIGDSRKDCFYGEDENDAIILPIMSSFNLTDRFKCKTDNNWMVRIFIFYYDQYSDVYSYNSGYGKDESYQLYVGKCRRPLDLACQFIRGTYIPSVYNIFRENRNGKNHTKFAIDNETDETNCDEWSTYQCDDYWDFSNGVDEIYCPNTISYYLKENIFKCNINEHYCAYQNGTIGCLSKEYAGNGIVDCLGASDERKTGEHIYSSAFYNNFKCLSKQYINVYYLCDGYPDCKHSDDEIMCPWIFNLTFDSLLFPCKNGTYIPRVRKQCNKIIDCQPDGEDEWFCDLIYSKQSQFLLNNVEEHPLTNQNSSKIIIINDH